MGGKKQRGLSACAGTRAAWALNKLRKRKAPALGHVGSTKGRCQQAASTGSWFWSHGIERHGRKFGQRGHKYISRPNYASPRKMYPISRLIKK